MLDRDDVPQVFVSYTRDSTDHVRQVLTFATFLRETVGLDVRLDLWDENRRRDWSLWAIERLGDADFIVVVASPAYRRAGDDTALPGADGRSRLEAALLRDQLTQDLRSATERILPVVLPGRSADELPAFLNAHCTTTFPINSLTETGVASLLAAITGYGQYQTPVRGAWRDSVPAVARQRQVPVVGLSWLPSGADVRPDGAWIDGMYYADSIVLRSKSPTAVPGFVEADLGRAYRRMTSVVGVLDDAVESFQVGYFRVHLDGEPRPEYPVSWGKPNVVEVDVTGVTRLRLEMWRAGGAPELAWGNPTLHPA